MGGRLTGKTALITAAGQGIGHATAVAFQKEGARLWATDIDERKLAGLATLKGVTCRSLDVRDESAVVAAAEEIGALDVLFNCAGRVPHGTLLDCEPADWAETLDLNVTAMYRIIRAFLPAMLAADGGSIVNMASVVSSVKAAPDRCAYGASKAAVIGLTKSVALDYATQGVRLQCGLPRRGRDAVAGRAVQCATGPGGGARGLHLAHSAGTNRGAGRDRRTLRLSRLGRIGPRDRPGVGDRRRLQPIAHHSRAGRPYRAGVRSLSRMRCGLLPRCTSYDDRRRKPWLAGPSLWKTSVAGHVDSHRSHHSHRNPAHPGKPGMFERPHGSAERSRTTRGMTA